MVLYICGKLGLLGRTVEFLARSFFFETMPDLKFHLDNDDLEHLTFQSSHPNVPGLQVCAGSKLFQPTTRLGFIGTSSWGRAKTHYMDFSSKLFLALQEHISILGENSSYPTQSPWGVAYSVICLVSATCFLGISRILPKAGAASSLALFQTETDHQRYMPLLNSSIVRCSNDCISCVIQNKLLKNSI